jgi:hypothetical protein
MIESTIKAIDESYNVKSALKVILALGTIFFLSFLVILILFVEMKVVISEDTINTMRVVNCVMALIASISCCLYYYGCKDSGLLLISLFYINMAIEAITNMYFFIYKENIYLSMLGVENVSLQHTWILGTFFRGGIIFLACYFSEKEIKISTKNKYILSIVIALLAVLFANIEIKIFTPKFIFTENRIELYIFILMFVEYLFAGGFLLHTVISKGKIIYSLIINSIFLILLNNIYTFVATDQNTFLIFLGTIFHFISFILPNMGVGIELITKIMKVDKLQKELKMFFSIVEENKNNVILIYNEDNEVIYGNKLYRKINNIKLEDFPINFDDLLKNVKFGDGIEDLNKSLQERDSWQGNVEVILDKNRIINVDLQRIEYDKNDKHCIICKDITEEFNMANKLKISEEKLRTINANIHDLICSTDKNGRMEYLSPSVSKILGYTNEELVGYNWFSLVHPLDIVAVRKIFSYNNEETVITEHRIKGKNGKYIWVESVSSVLKTEDEEIIGKVIISRDISYRKEIQRLKTEYNEIKEYERIRGEFFANLSHELRTPINIIFSCIQLLDYYKEDKDSLSQYYTKYEKTIKQNCFRMLRLVNNLIDITKIDSGFMKLDLINCDIVKIVEDITLSVIPYVEVKNINLIFDTEFEEKIIKCDPDKIERIILNLLSNSIKFTDFGGEISVNISLVEDFVQIKVRDNGKGIPIEKRKIIFDRFVQVDKSLNRSHEGSGIGLALSKSLIELHNGKIFINDEVEKGTEIIILLPDKMLKNEGGKAIEYDTYKPNIDRISIEFSDIYELY